MSYVGPRVIFSFSCFFRIVCFFVVLTLGYLGLLNIEHAHMQSSRLPQILSQQKGVEFKKLREVYDFLSTRYIREKH
jgi:hypothetical protein